jgi:hypothetical protein
VLQEKLEKSQAKYKTRHDKHRVDHSFQVGDEVWLYISKERLKGEVKKLKPIRYGPFKIIDKIGNNAFRLDLPPYMQMYAIVNVENLKLYEPPLIDDHGEHVQIPSIDDFPQNILQNCMKTPFLIGECELQNKEMWSIFELVLKVQIQAKPSGLRLEG